MATIKSILALEDKMTPTLSKAEKQAIANYKTFSNLEKSTQEIADAMKNLESAGLADTKMFNDLAEAGGKNVATMVELAEGTKNAQQSSEELSKSAIELNQKLELLQKAWGALQSVMQQANSWMEENNKQFNSQFTSAIKMHNVLGANKEEIQSMYDYAESLQKVGVVGDEAVIAGMSELSMYASTVDQVRKLTPAILDLAIAENGLNTTQSNVESTANMVGRALNGSAMMLKRQLGLTDAQVKSLDAMNDKTEKAAYLYQLIEDRTRGANEMLAQTSQGGILQANNAMSDFAETLGSKVTPYIAQFKQTVVEILTPAVQWLADNADWVIPIFLTLAGVIGTLIFVTTIWTLVNNKAALSLLKVIWPLLLILGIIYLVKLGFEKLTGATINFVGLVAGMISVLAAIIYNIVAAIWNVIASAIDKLVDLIRVKALVATTILWGIATIIHRIAQLFDTIFGTGLANATQGIVDNLRNTMSSISEQIGNESVAKLEFKDLGEAARAGYNWGTNFSEGIKTGTGDLDLEKMLGGFTDNFNDIIGTDEVGGKALKTTSNDSVELKDEDIQLLLDVATRDFKLNYQQITPEITVTFGDVHETADVDGVLEQIVDEIEEVYQANLEVVPG